MKFTNGFLKPVKMVRIQYIKFILYSRTKHLICNLTQFEALLVWKKFLLGLFLLTVLVILIFLVIGDDISSDPLVKLIVVPATDKYINRVDFVASHKYLDKISTKLVDLSEFKYLLTPSCNLSNITKILIVTSFAGNIESRSAFRIAYPESVLHMLGIKRVFLLGQLKDHQSDITQNALLNENERYNDLLQGNFYEAYRNLTYKHVMGLKWIAELPLHCDNESDYTYNTIRHVIKMDDDIVVDLYNLVNLIDNYKKQVNYDMIGYVLENVRPIRLKANKWYVTKSEFSENIYPKFLSGWLYVTTPEIATKLVKLSNVVKYFWIDDVYVSGILANMINVRYTDIHNNITLHPELFECCMRDNVSCYIIAGPNGGDHDLQIKYEKHVKKCMENNCLKITFSKHKCVTQRKTPSIGKGFAELKLIKL